MKRKFLLIVLVICLIISLLVNTANAASFIATMTASKTTVAESTEFTVTVKVSNIDAGTNGINSVEGIFSYDNKVFEAVTNSGISGLNEWAPNYFADTGKIVLFKTSYTKNDEDILQITLKTKAGTAGKSGVVSFKNISASNSEAEIPAADISTTITVGNSSSANAGNTSSNQETNSTPQQIATTVPVNNTNTNTNTTNNAIVSSNIVTPSTVNKTSDNTNVSDVDSTTESDIPYTGASDNIMRAIFVVLVIAGISYLKYESIKEN